jgi:hypothetical protein
MDILISVVHGTFHSAEITFFCHREIIHKEENRWTSLPVPLFLVCYVASDWQNYRPLSSRNLCLKRYGSEPRVRTYHGIGLYHRLNMELDLQSLFGLHVHSCTVYSLAETPQSLPPHSRSYTVTSRDVNFCNPDRVPLTQFVKSEIVKSLVFIMKEKKEVSSYWESFLMNISRLMHM